MHENPAARVQRMRCRAVATKNRRITRRLRSEAVLADLLPPLPAANTAYHCISHGDVDSLSYLAHLVKSAKFDAVLISTWCMAMPDVDLVLHWIATGQVGRADFYGGEILPGSYPDETDKLDRAQAEGRPVSLTIARNHAKIMLAHNTEDDLYIAIESSANVNTNPRIEQTCITRDRELWEFYREFFTGLQSVHKNPYLEKRQ